jgi:pimeloyl-ACP methyl ester carboxylesterase
MKAGIEEGGVDVDGLHFRYLAAGPPSGRPALLLHGFPEGAESWLDQLEALAAAGYRALAPDLRGYGGSDCPEGVDQYEIKRLAGDVAGLAQHLGSPVHLAGHDWGAMIGWTLVIRQPELVRSWASLSIAHPAALGQAAREDADQQERSGYIRLFLQEGKAEEVLAGDGFQRLRGMFRSVSPPDAVPQELVQRYVHSLSRPHRLTAALNYYRANLGRDGTWSDLASSAPATKTPTLLVWGDQDRALGRSAVDRTAEHMAGPYTLEVLEGAGHWLQLERPSQVSALLVRHFDSQ